MNQNPSDILLSATTFTSHSAVGTVVATLSTVDPNPGDTFTYSLVQGHDSDNNSAFSIHEDKLKVANSDLWPGFYKLRLRSTDASGMSVEKSFVVEAVFGLSCSLACDFFLETESPWWAVSLFFMNFLMKCAMM